MKNYDDGPLPQDHRNRQLEILTQDALAKVLPKDRFLLRAEPGPDEGVDRYIELIGLNGFTNYRSQIQLKGTDNEELNNDDSFSLLVDTSNLNYLLRLGLSPLYVLLIVARNELRYVWATDEEARIDKINPTWKTQEKITLRFEKVLELDALDEIEARIVTETTFKRRIMDTVRTLNDLERATIVINPKQMTVADHESAMQRLLRDGVDMVSEGLFIDVENLYYTLLPIQKSDLHVKLIYAYLQIGRGRFYEALGLLGEVYLSRQELSHSELSFLTFLQRSLEYQTGKLSAEEYAAALDDMSSDDDDPAALVLRQSILRFRFLSTMRQEDRTIAFNQITDVVNTIISNPEIPATSKLQARISLLFLEAELISERLITTAEDLGIRVRAGITEGLPTPDEVIKQAMGTVEQDITEILEEAIGLESQTMEYEAYITRGVIRLTTAGTIILSCLLGAPFTKPDSLLENASVDAIEALHLAEQLKSHDGKSRAQLLLAKISEISGRPDDARDLSIRANDEASAMGNELVASAAARQMSGYTSWSTALEQVLAWLQQGPDAIANYTDDELKYMANREISALNMPLERHDAIFERLRISRDEARRRIEERTI